MQKHFRALKTISLGLVILLGLTFNSCKKKGPKGDTGATGEAGPGAKTFYFDLSFEAGDKQKTFKDVKGYNDADAIMVYINSGNSWTQLPAQIDLNVYFTPEINKQSGAITIHSLRADGTFGSPWINTVTRSFKAVLIKSS